MVRRNRCWQISAFVSTYVVAIRPRSRRIRNPGAGWLIRDKSIIPKLRLPLLEPPHHRRPNRPRICNRSQKRRRISRRILPPRRARLRNIVRPKGIRVSAHHLGDAGIARPEKVSKDLGVGFVEEDFALRAVPPVVDPSAPGRGEADEDAVLGRARRDPVDEGKVVLVRPCRVRVVEDQVAVEVGESCGVILGHNDGLDDVEAFGCAVREVQVGVGAVEAVEKLPIGVGYPHEWLPRLRAMEVAPVFGSADGKVGPWHG